MITLPKAALALLMGASGSGKSTFAKRHFARDDVVSSDQLRGLLSGDEGDQQATEAAFGRLHQWLDARLAAGMLAGADATNTNWLRRAGPRPAAPRPPPPAPPRPPPPAPP